MKVLFLLRSDCGNLALAKIAKSFLDMGHKVYGLLLSNNANDTFMLDLRIIKITLSDAIAKGLNDYSCIIASRNCFFMSNLSFNKLLVDFKGVIFTEHTTLYEGDNVYGDFVFVSGTHNYHTIPKQIIHDIPALSVGCLKGKTHPTVSVPDFCSNCILFIESGHYPFGREGRVQLTKCILKLCERYPERDVVLKPRYLPSECATSLHRNADHIYDYIYNLSNGVVPSNLHLLEKHYPLANLINLADVILHTYSSAFAEAVFWDKPIINLADICSLETVDLRKQRFELIKDYIDKIDCNMSVNSDIMIEDAQKCSIESKKYLFGENDASEQSIVDMMITVIEKSNHNQFPTCGYYTDIETVNYSYWDFPKIRKIRTAGLIKNMIYHYAIRFDDFISFDQMATDLVNDIFEKKLCFENIMNRFNDLLSNYIKHFYEKLINDKINRAALLEYMYQHNDDCFFENSIDSFKYKDAAYYLFFGLFMQKKGNTKCANLMLEKYLKIVSKLPFDETCADSMSYQIQAKNIIRGLYE